MATQEEHQQLVDDIKSELDVLINTEIEKLTREKDLREYSFKQFENLFVDIIDLFKTVNEVDLVNVPYSVLSEFNTSFSPIKTICISIKGSASSYLSENRDKLIKQLQEGYLKSWNIITPILALDLSADKLEEGLSKVEFIIKEVNTMANKLGVATHSRVFEKQAEEHEKSSNFWFWAIVVVSGLIVGFAVISFFIKAPEDDEYFKIIQFTATKIIIFFTLFYGLAICSRNYKASKHNATLNKHRENALSTFEVFAKAADSDKEIKNAVLLAATNTIFSNQTTGYLDTGGDSDSPNKIIDVIKNLTDKK